MVLVQLVSLAKSILPTLRISPQGLHKRINAKATAFLMKMFAKSLMLSIDRKENLVPLLSPFDKVHLLDSSQIILPKEVSHLFAGSGGSSSEAGAKIQLMIDYKTGNFSHLWLTDAKAADQNQMFTALKQIHAGELMIFDLGYFSQSALTTLADNEAFFLCRLLIQTALYQKTEWGAYKRMDLSEIQKPKSFKQVSEIEIYLGAKAKLPCRLIIQPIPLIEVNKRRRRLKANAKKKGRTVSQKLLKSFAHLPLVAPKILDKLRNPFGLLKTLVEVADEMMTLCRMDKRLSRGSTAETLRLMAV